MPKKELNNYSIILREIPNYFAIDFKIGYVFF